MLTKPPKLLQGDTIGIVSPSSGLAASVPHRVERGVKALKNLGFNVKFGKNALKECGYTSGTPEERADDINTIFADDSVKAIITTIGGEHSNQILEYLDFPLIRKNPKIFIGYSDTTVIHLALQKECSLLTFYGPALLTQFGEYPEIFQYTKEYFLKALTSSELVGNIEPSSFWTDELLDWLSKKDIERPRKLFSNKERKWLRKGRANGAINGGCITSLQHLRGTKYWPDFTGNIFFWEIPESQDIAHGVSPVVVDSLLANLELSGVFKQISGMLVGRTYGYSNEDDEMFANIILERTKKYSFPILYNVEIGHADPIATIPLGAKAEMDSKTNSIRILESGVV